MPLPSKREKDELRRRLEAWCSDQLGTPCHIDEVTVPEGTGMSSETLLFELQHDGEREPLVARMQPDMDDFPVFPRYELMAQAEAMRFVAERSDVPVPTVRWIEEDPEPVGAPFFVMDRVAGRALPDMPPYVFGGSFLDELTPAERRQLQDEAVAVLARIHAIDLADGDVSFAGDPAGDTLGRQLRDQHDYYAWARGDERYPLIEEALAWLDEHRPTAPGPTVLNWGDARPGNILFDGLRPAAVLDWEMVTLGPAGVDVAWMIFLHGFFQDLATGYGFPGFPDLLQRDDVVATYQAAGGAPIDDLAWYEVFAATRFAIVSVRTSARAVAYGDMPAPDEPEGLIMHRAMIRRMLDGTYWDQPA